MNAEAGFPTRPPHERGTWRAFLLAVLMHALLGLFLYYGMHWQNSTPAGAEAELWTEVPDMSTPRPPPPPAPAVKVQPAPPVAQEDQADIALMEKKKRQQEAAEKQLQLAEQQRQQKLKADQQAQAQKQQLAAQLAAEQAAATAKLKQIKQQQQADKLKQQQLVEQRAEKTKQDQAKQDQLKAQQDQLKEQQLKQEQADKKAEQQKTLKAKQATAQAAKAQADKERKTRLAALQGMAGDSPTGNGLANGGNGSGSGGNAASAGYADKVKRRVRPNIRATIDFDASLTTVVSVSCAPDGALLSASIQRPSGNAQWDDVALRAVKDSDPMPRDVNGKTPAHFTITLKPKG